jgi:hypothetical protein
MRTDEPLLSKTCSRDARLLHSAKSTLPSGKKATLCGDSSLPVHPLVRLTENSSFGVPTGGKCSRNVSDLGELNSELVDVELSALVGGADECEVDADKRDAIDDGAKMDLTVEVGMLDEFSTESALIAEELFGAS